MKKFFLKTAILCIPFIMIPLLMVLLSPLPENAYNLALIDKNQLLMNTGSPKIALAGGSNLAFGIESAMIHNTLHIPVVNMGVHAGFGLGRILDDVSPFLRRGDILVIVPEYSQFTTGWNGGSAAYELIFDMRQYQCLLSPYYEFPADLSGYLLMHRDILITRIMRRDSPPNPLAYSRDGFNEYGDYVKHLTTENQPFISSGNAGSLNYSYLGHFFQFIDFFTKRGITVMLSYPSFEEQSYLNSVALIKELDAIFRKKENLKVISSPERYCFPTGLFYDTVHHLNAEGRNLRTRQLLEDLQASGFLDH